VTEQRGGGSLPAADGMVVRQVSCHCQLPPEALSSHLIFVPTSTAPSRGRGDLGGGLLDWFGVGRGNRGEREHTSSCYQC
jgi:hypothetical protein